ncbi:MAG TPA: S8 family peptidase [Pyrinomonadaceae bacterium]|nr:S8 family peptidase [Pyrinomonadaceae bacterium]
MKRVFAMINCAALFAAFVFPTLAQTNRSGKLDNGPEFVPGEMLIQFKAGTAQAEIDEILERVDAQVSELIRPALSAENDRGDLVLATFSPLVSFEFARREIESKDTVEFVEPNWIYRHQATSDDTYYTNGSLWGMYGDATSRANQYGSQAGEAWAAGKSSCGSVYVGIIDEGYYYDHEDLAANAGTNPGDGTFDGVDNDGNGYVDDVYGWDFAGNDNSVFDGITDDHGTHVAGTIGGVGGNGIGVAGVCWSVKLMNAKFLGRNGGTTANPVKAVDYFTDMKTRHGINMVATSNSWGGGGFSQALSDAIGRANTANILFVAAAGNDSVNCETSSCYPAEYSSANVIAVASITSTGAMSSFSNYGGTTIDIGAPGSGVWSTVPKRASGDVVSGYASYSGTSMATPHVSGAAALYAAYHPGSSAATIKSAIMSAAQTASLSGKVVSGGRLNVSGF